MGDWKMLTQRILECCELLLKLKECVHKMNSSPDSAVPATPVDALRHLFESEPDLKPWIEGRVDMHEATMQECIDTATKILSLKQRLEEVCSPLGSAHEAQDQTQDASPKK